MGIERILRPLVAVWLMSALAGVLLFGKNSEAQVLTPTPDDQQETACQLYHLTVNEARVRDCAGENCSVISGVLASETLCIRGIAPENADWAVVDLDPGNPASAVGYINVDIIAAGAAGVNPSLYTYCDSWKVTASEAVVRACPQITCAALGGLPQGEQICATDYTASYVSWALVSNPTGQAQWVDRAGLVEAEGDEFCDAWRINDAAAVARECPDINCGIVRNFTLGEELCVIDENEDDLEWISFDYSGNIGWLFINSLLPVEQTDEAPTPNLFPTVVSPTPTPTQDMTQSPAPTSSPEARQSCFFYTVNVFSAVVRSRPTTDSDLLTTAPRNTRICVVGVVPYLENDWYVVDLNPAGATPTEGFMHQSLLVPVSAPVPVTAITQATPQPQDGGSVPTVAPDTTGVPGVLICPPQGIRQQPFDTSGSETQNQATTTPYPPGYCLTATPTPLLTPPPTQVASQALLSQDIPLPALGARNVELASPQSSAQFRFSLPDDWHPIGDSVLYLNLEYFESLNSTAPADGTALTTQLDIRLDSTLISSVSLTSNNVGVQTLAIPLPVEILTDPIRRSHSVELSLDAQDHCNSNSLSRVFSNSEKSFIHFEYNEFLPTLDLARFPRPFYNNRPNNELESVILVLPQAFQEEDLQAAASIAAGMGLLTGNTLQIQVATADTITEQERQSSHLVLIGQLGTNRLIDSLYETDLLPTRFNAEDGLQFLDTALATTDGVVQLISHPENPKRAIMVVTGQSERALLQAAQALAGPPSVMGLGGTLAIISEAQSLVHLTNTSTSATRLTFADLGIAEDIVINGIGTQIVEVDFYFPLGNQLADDAYVDVLFNSSAALASPQTTFTLLINDTPIASTVLDIPEGADPNVAQGPKRIRVAIPPSAVISGADNKLVMIVDTQEDWDCNPPGRAAAWFAISNQSEIYLPRTALPSQFFRPLVAQFPVPFNTTPNLSDVWVSLPATPSPTDITQAIQLISRLGASTSNGEGLAPQIRLGDPPDGVDLADFNFILIGRPTTNPFVARINDALPQPFIEDTDELQQILDDVTYRLLPGFEIGILETLDSPWADDRVILVITGTSDSGQANAVNVLTSFDLGRSELAGDVVFATGNSVAVVDTSNVYNVLEILEAIPDLLFESNSPAATATSTPFQVFTVTPMPLTTVMPTSALSPTPFSALIFGATITPVPPTPIPTFEALGDNTFDLVDQEPPNWANMLLIITAGSLAIAAGYGLIRLLRSSSQH